MKAFNASIDVNARNGKNTRFWAAAGLDSLYALTHTEGGKFLLDRMQDKQTCRFLRNHHALSEFVYDGLRSGGEVYDEDENGNPIYRFERMNAVYTEYIKRGIKPVVEMDYLPANLIRRDAGKSGGDEEGWYSERSWPNNWDKWAALLRAFTQNLIDTFGVNEVRTWYFEVWNEPDGWPVCDWPQFYRLYDVFADAVTGVDNQLRIGGPGTYQLAFLRGFLEHVSNGTNYVTGKTGSRIDFISHHIYGVSGSWLEPYPLVMPTVQRFVHEILWIQRMLENYPVLSGKEFHLNEWGVLSHYAKGCKESPPMELRNSEFSALFFIKLVNCIQEIHRVFDFEVSMLLYWGFCVEDSLNRLFYGNRSLTTAGHVLKPIQVAHEMLAMMGEDLLHCNDISIGGPLGILAARNENEVQVLAYLFNEFDEEGQLPPSSGEIKLDGLTDETYRISCYVLDNNTHNTYRLWQRMGSPDDPVHADLEALRYSGELRPQHIFNVQAIAGSIRFPVSISAQSACLYRVRKLGLAE